MENDESCRCCADEARHRHTPRDPEEIRQLKNRLSRMSGQLSGISRMLDENRYCGDILIQIAAVEKALQSLGYIILRGHMESCVAEALEAGDDGIIDETIELMKKLK